MAVKDKKSPKEKPLVVEKGDNAPLRLRMGEIGQTGLIVLGGQVGLETEQWELQWPACINTYNKMRQNATISTALNLIEMEISRREWAVRTPRHFSKVAKDRSQYLLQCMQDMDTPWSHFIKSASSFNTYGFSMNEIVFRLRRKRNGSKYDDGLVGIAKLTPRSQDTVYKWNYDENSRELLSFEQKVYKNTSNSVTPTANYKPTVTIPRSKFLLFRNHATKDSPLGVSSLAAVWESWKYMTAIQEFEAVGIATDSRGLKVLKIPPQYMAEDATDEDKKTFEYFKTALNNVHKSEQSGLIIPQIYDPDSRMPMFDLQLLGVGGQRTVDPNIVIERYKKDILTAMFADSVLLGQGSGGSHSLADNKGSTVETYVESKLDEIKDQLNHQLVRMLWEANGWELDELPEIYYKKSKARDLEAYGGFVQRTSSTGYLPKTIEVINDLLDQLGIEPYPDDTPLEDLNLPEDVSSAGEGMVVGTTGNGTAKKASGKDSSVSNVANN